MKFTKKIENLIDFCASLGKDLFWAVNDFKTQKISAK
jgi:hypothetical protein